jgi:AraC-like DNA-binding protein
VKLAREYLHALPQVNVSLKELAQEAGLSAFHLSRVFRQEVGLSPHAYHVLIRVRFAKELLAQGYPVSHVALEAGFFDQAHFTKHFKRIFGVTPGRYLSTQDLSARRNRGSD